MLQRLEFIAEKMTEEIKYDIRWSDSLDEEFINDYIEIQRNVFGSYSIEEFQIQFIKNIYGSSLLVVVYIYDKPVAARCLWRNDICGMESYQPGSTCVLPECRGKGIFREMTMRAIALLPSNVVIYNFPNNNSYTGYLKMGWHLACGYRARLFLSYKRYKSEHPIQMDSEYFQWWAREKELGYAMCGNHYFLVKRDHRPFCVHIISELSKDNATQLPRFRGILFYKSLKDTFYNKSLGQCHVVCRENQPDYIPVWKMDAI